MHWSRIILLLACLTGCSRSADDNAPTTRPALKSIDLHEGIYLARHDLHITIAPDGLLRSIRTENKSFGPNDIDPKNERVEIREGKLTHQQISELANLFANWDSLPADSGPGVADGPSRWIIYGGKTVSGNAFAPTMQFSTDYESIRQLAGSMPRVDR